MFQKVSLDVTYLLNEGGRKALVVARDNLSRWPEARVLVKINSEAIASFI